jgi:hypothetical protein
MDANNLDLWEWRKGFETPTNKSALQVRRQGLRLNNKVLTMTPTDTSLSDSQKQWIAKMFKETLGDVVVAEMVLRKYQFPNTSSAAPVSLYMTLLKQHLLMLPSEGGEAFRAYLELVMSVDPNLTLDEFWLPPIELDPVAYAGPYDHTNEVLYKKITGEVQRENARISWRRAESHNEGVLPQSAIQFVKMLNRSFLQSNQRLKPRHPIPIRWLNKQYVYDLQLIDSCFKELGSWCSFYQFLRLVSQKNDAVAMEVVEFVIVKQRELLVDNVLTSKLSLDD